MDAYSEEYKLFIANSFWPAFWDCWRRSKFRFALLTIKQSYIQWREADTDSILWFLKSFLKGFNLYFLVMMVFCVGIAELSYLYAFLTNPDLGVKRLGELLFLALPALIGTTILDYVLEMRKRPTVSLVALLVLVILACLACCLHVRGQDDSSMYFITLGVVFFFWCVKAYDPKMNNLEKNATSVLPGPIQIPETARKESTTIRDGKKIIIERNGGAEVSK